MHASLYAQAYQQYLSAYHQYMHAPAPPGYPTPQQPQPQPPQQYYDCDRRRVLQSSNFTSFFVQTYLKFQNESLRFPFLFRVNDLIKILFESWQAPAREYPQWPEFHPQDFSRENSTYDLERSRVPPPPPPPPPPSHPPSFDYHY